MRNMPRTERAVDDIVAIISDAADLHEFEGSLYDPANGHDPIDQNRLLDYDETTDGSELLRSCWTWLLRSVVLDIKASRRIRLHAVKEEDE
jgi:hypothetical protein